VKSTSLEMLLRIAGPPVGGAIHDQDCLASWGNIGGELARLLSDRNGFYAFESALLLRPLTSSPEGVLGISEWNQPKSWRFAYDGLGDGLLFFAEDVFGGQFCISRDGVVSFDPETGETELLATTLDGWAEELLADYEILTGQPLAHAWQASHGRLVLEQRLVPKTPFVLGGEFGLSNLRVGNSVTEMLARAHIAVQIRDLPEGATIRLTVVD
jgi:hypothetical protein